MSDIRIERPYRRKQTGRFDLAAPPDAVFAMMCPVREYEWEPGWTTNVILSESGLAEEGCVFMMPAGASIGSSKESSEAIWVTPTYDAGSAPPRHDQGDARRMRDAARHRCR
ncbi:MAG: hypothetical protein R3C58_12755 [Parvularculaceae bacterium]